MYNLIEFSNNYSKTSGGLQQYCKDIPAEGNRLGTLKLGTCDPGTWDPETMRLANDPHKINNANATDSFDF